MADEAIIQVAPSDGESFSNLEQEMARHNKLALFCLLRMKAQNQETQCE